MEELAKIDDEVITAEDFIKLLKYRDKFSPLLEEILGHKLTVHAARKKGMTVSEEEVQERLDQYRRIYQLHRAKDMVDHLEEMGLSLEEFAKAIEEDLLHEKMSAKIQDKKEVDDYFQLNSPKYESVQLSHIVLTSEGITQEIMAILEDEPESFAEMAKEHSMATDTAEKGGSLGKVFRGTLIPELEAKIFNATAGDIVGPFTDNESLLYEIFYIEQKYPAQCDSGTEKQIQKQLYDNWLELCTNDHKVEIS